jgi:hypothetical protein
MSEQRTAGLLAIKTDILDGDKWIPCIRWTPALNQEGMIQRGFPSVYVRDAVVNASSEVARLRALCGELAAKGDDIKEYCEMWAQTPTDTKLGLLDAWDAVAAKAGES